MVFVYRDFGYYDKNGNVTGSIGDIRLYIRKNNKITVYISDLYNDKIQTTISIKYSPVLPLYNIILIIFEKLFYDLVYQQGQTCKNNHKDFIINDDNSDIEIWNKNTKTNNCGAFWLPFTPENMKYVNLDEDDEDDDYDLNGEVLENGDFYYNPREFSRELP